MAGAGGTTSEDVVLGSALDWLARDRSAVGHGVSSTGLVSTGDGRQGLAIGAQGSPAWASTLTVDGLAEVLLGHPGMPGEPGTAPAFSHSSVSQASSPAFALDTELPAAAGPNLSLLSSAGARHEGIRPWATWSGTTLGGSADDNPADSSGSSFGAGIDLGGSLGSDGSTWGVNFAFEKRREPAAAPYFGIDQEAAEALQSAAGTRDVGSWISPVVHGWEGFTGSGQVAMKIGRRSTLNARVGVASWEEEAPRVAAAGNGAGSLLEGKSLSAAAALMMWGEAWHSTTRVGLSDAQRDWTGAGLPTTDLVFAGWTLGGGALPGMFSERRLQLSETVRFTSGAHTIKLGGSIGQRTVNHDWLIHGEGRASFGSMADFAAGVGSWVRATDPATVEDLKVNEFAIFLQDIWRLSDGFSVIGGLRYQGQELPTDRFSASSDFLLSRLGLLNNFVPTTHSSAAGPRLGFTWDASGDGRTIVSASGGIVPGDYDLAAISEVLRYDGGVSIERATGSIGWPEGGSASVTESRGYALLGPDVRAPRTTVMRGSLRQALGAGVVLQVAGGYHHGDYLLRRADYNRPSSPLAHTEDGRALWGNLEQHGSLLVAAPGTNRRIADLDHVWGLAPTGFSDHYEATASLSATTASGISLRASYTWARTEDNMVGQLSPDPADRAAPIEVGEDGDDWSDGRSDLDVPGRAVVSIGYTLPGESGVELGARWRWRSGLPFTPGYRRGVDVNADGSGGNDPVALGSVAGLSGLLSGAGCDSGSDGFARRNSCRAPSASALDLHAGIRLPFAGNGVVLTVEAFNLVASEVGLIDNAALLVDPDRSVGSTGDGRVSLPLMLNENFGELLARRNDPRTIRLGLRLEN